MDSIRKLSLVLVALALLMQNGCSTEAARILGIFPVPSRSHFAGCEVLMRGLAARGHRVDVVSPFPLKDPPPNYRDISMAGGLSIYTNMTVKQSKMYTAFNIRNIFKSAGISLCETLKLSQIRNIIQNPPTDPPYDIIINEFLAADCYMAFARHLKIPLVGVVPNKLFDWQNELFGNPTSTAFVPSTFSGFGQRMTFLERVHNTLYSFYLRAFYYWYNIPSQLHQLEKYFGLKLGSTTELYKDVALVLVNSHPSFDFVRPMTPGIVEVGGLHVTDGQRDLSPEVKKWLDESEAGCVYFSFGSMVLIESFPEDILKAFYEAFERIAPVRVLMRIKKPEDLPPGLPKNVLTSPWFPQARVLKHRNTKAFISHCGLMSMQEAVVHAVPIIGIPVFSDQFLNMRLIEKHDIGLRVNYENITADYFTNIVSTVLKNSTFSENSKRLAKLYLDRPMSPLDTAIFWVEYVLRNGNVLRSPAADLAWWQFELLDVYGFMLLIAGSAIYTVNRLCSKLARWRKPRVNENAVDTIKKNR